MNKFVYPKTGEILEAAYIDKERKRFWTKDQLTKAGIPDARKIGYKIGLERYECGFYSSGYVPYNAQLETSMSVWRARRKKLIQEANDTEKGMMKTYFDLQGTI